MSVRFFIDSADTEAWARFHAEGWVHGATTNPTILARAGLPVTLETAARLVGAAEKLAMDEIQVQTWGETSARLIETGLALAAISPLVTVKVPATREGLVAAARIKAEGARVTLTACYAAHQVALADAMGLDYVAPYYGRMLEADMQADRLLEAMQMVTHGGLTRILIASIRSTVQVDHLLAMGFDTFTLAPAIAAKIGQEAHAEAAAAAFEAAARGEVRPD